MGLTFSEITEIVTLFQYPEVSSDNDEQNVNEAKNVNKDSSITKLTSPFIGHIS